VLTARDEEALAAVTAEIRAAGGRACSVAADISDPDSLEPLTEEALAQFQVVLSAYPRSRKIPDALLKIGYSYYELEQWDGARSALQTVRDEHPDSTAARLAEQRLKRMDDEGH